MLVEEEILGDTYKALMDYLFKKCDSISLTKYREQHEDDRIHDLSVILKETGYSINDIIDNYSIQFLDEIYDKFKDNAEIFDEQAELFTRRYDKKYKKRVTDATINWVYYNNNTEKWLTKNVRNIINCKKNDNCLGNPNVYHSDTYTFKLNEEIKSEILSKKSLYDWGYPDSLEDICFFKDGYCFLETITHENLCFIYCDDKEEYEYLKSIGIKIFEKEFKPTKMGKWEYGDGNKQ